MATTGFYKIRSQLRSKSRRRCVRADALYAGLAALIVLQLAQIWLAHLGHALVRNSAIELIAMFSALGIFGLSLSARLLISSEGARAETIADYLNEGLLFVQDQRVAFANPLARKLVGGEGTLIEPQSPIGLALDQACRSQAPMHFETEREGRTQHFLVSRLQVTDEPAQTDTNVFVFQDVTFLRENEEAKVNFIGALSHEIKTPITSLAMALAMLDRTGFDPELVRIANADVGRLRILLEDLLNVSKLKVVRNPNMLQKRNTNLNALIQQTLRATARLAEETGVALQSKIQPRGGFLMANIDPTKITWLLSTLLTDAIRQTPSGQNVSLELDHDGHYATLTVGYKRRLDALGPTSHAIVRDIVEAHAGSFTSMHLADGRSIFRVSIPAGLGERAVGARATNHQGINKHETHLIG